MNDQEFLDSLKRCPSGESERKAKGRLMAVLLDMADKEWTTRQCRGAGGLFYCLRVWLSLLRVRFTDRLSGEWQRSSQAARAQTLYVWHAVLYVLRWLRIDPVEETRRSRNFTTEQKSLCLKMHEGFRRLMRQLLLLEVPAVLLSFLAIGMSLLVQIGIEYRMPVIPVVHIHLRWLNNASMLLAEAAAFLGVMATVVILPHAVRLLKVFQMVKPPQD